MARQHDVSVLRAEIRYHHRVHLERCGPHWVLRCQPRSGRRHPERGGVCYDLRHPGEAGKGFDALVLRLSAPRELKIAYDPTPSPAPRCTVLPEGGVTAWTTTYVH